MRLKIISQRQKAVGLPTLLILAMSTWLSGQDDAGPEDDVFELSPFEVSTSQDVGYLSTNSTSGTSLNTAIKDLPMSIQVVNQDFITDIAATNLDEALVYAAGEGMDTESLSIIRPITIIGSATIRSGRSFGTPS
jgi:outer membrane receptor for ferric coprogen and ferric-rhodotorulic acid